MIEIQIQLQVRPNKMEDVLALLYEDQGSVSHTIFSQFDIMCHDNNKIEIKAVCQDMETLSQHMLQTHYRWHEMKQNGYIISQKHYFVSL